MQEAKHSTNSWRIRSIAYGGAFFDDAPVRAIWNPARTLTLVWNDSAHQISCCACGDLWEPEMPGPVFCAGGTFAVVCHACAAEEDGTFAHLLDPDVWSPYGLGFFWHAADELQMSDLAGKAPTGCLIEYRDIRPTSPEERGGVTVVEADSSV